MQLRREFGRVIQLKKIPPQSLVRLLSPEVQEGSIDVKEAALKIEDVIKIRGVREHRLVDARTKSRPLGQRTKIRHRGWLSGPASGRRRRSPRRGIRMRFW